jgi:hypothetical protein
MSSAPEAAAAAPEPPVPEVPDSGTARVALTPAAAEWLVKLAVIHGPLMFPPVRRML